MAGGRLALIAGSGALPRHLAAALDAHHRDFLLVEMEGVPSEVKHADRLTFRLEGLAPFLAALAARGVDQVVMAGRIARPALDPTLVDPETAALLPDLLASFQQGDDATLRAIVDLFEKRDIAVVGPTDVAPDLLPAPDVYGPGEPSDADTRDADKGFAIIDRLGPLDVGQGAVVAQGLCLGIETQPGTDAMLRFVRETGPACRPDPRGAKGVLCKAPKPGQDRRVDLPAIGPGTIHAAAAADLAGVVIPAGGVMVLDRARVLDALGDTGLFLWVRGA